MGTTVTGKPRRSSSSPWRDSKATNEKEHLNHRCEAMTTSKAKNKSRETDLVHNVAKELHDGTHDACT